MLATSQEPVEIPQVAELPAFMIEEKTASKRDAADDILDNVFPHKQAKMSLENTTEAESSQKIITSSSPSSMTAKVREYTHQKRQQTDVVPKKGQ